MFSQRIVTKYWRKQKICLPFLSFELVSLKLCTSAARIFQSSQKLCCHHLCLCLNIRDRSWKTTQHLVENCVVITFVCMVENKGDEFIFLCFWALDKYSWSHIHLHQVSSKAQKVCAVITSVFAWISEIGVEKQHNIYYKLKQKWMWPSTFELWTTVLEAIYICGKDLPKLTKSVVVITFVSACTSEIRVEKQHYI